MAQVKAMTVLSRRLPRKRKKRKKRKLPRAPLPRCGRPCAVQRQVPAVQVVHVLEGAPASVHRQSVGPPRCATETWYPQCELCRRLVKFYRYSSWARSLRPCCATTDMWFDGAAYCGVPAVAVHRRSSTPLSFRRGRSPWSRLLSRPQRFPFAVRCQLVDAPVVQVVSCPSLCNDRCSWFRHCRKLWRCRRCRTFAVVDVAVISQRQVPGSPGRSSDSVAGMAGMI